MRLQNPALKIPQRINKILSMAGVVSRRKADDLIRAGRVSVNGRNITKFGSKALWGVDRIRVDGEEIPEPAEKIYLMLNKPFGYICALEDPQGRPVVTSLLKDEKKRVYPVGRLDFDSLGLLLLTDDGEWAHRLMHPRYRIPRTYKVTLRGDVSEEALEILRKGVELEDGFSGPAKTTLVRRDNRSSVLRMTIAIGKNRIVRRMIEAVGYEVVHLLRTGFGSLELGNLKIGQYRPLETHELETMKKMVGLR